jgi:hypothetical protein
MNFIKHINKEEASTAVIKSEITDSKVVDDYVNVKTRLTTLMNKWNITNGEESVMLMQIQKLFNEGDLKEPELTRTISFLGNGYFAVNDYTRAEWFLTDIYHNKRDIVSADSYARSCLNLAKVWRHTDSTSTTFRPDAIIKLLVTALDHQVG